MCIRVAAAYECQSACGPNTASLNEDHFYDGCELKRVDDPPIFCGQTMSGFGPQSACCKGDDRQQSNNHEPKVSNEASCGGCCDAMETEIQDSSSKQATKFCYVNYCFNKSKVSVHQDLEELNSNPSSRCNIKENRAMCNDQPEAGCPEGSCQDEMASDAGEADSTCQDTCCTAGESSNRNQSSSCSKESGLDRCDVSRRTLGQACRSHLESAFEKYATYIKIGRCICRSVLAPIETCCSKERREGAIQFKETAKQGSMIHPKRFDKKQMVKDSDKSGTKKVISTNKNNEHVFIPTEKALNPLTNKPVDIEKGDVNKGRRISITISGMTCAGCSKKGLNALNRIVGVADAKINFVASAGEFDLNPQRNPLEVIGQFERETGFKCALIRRDLQMLDVVMSKVEAKQLEDWALAGIDSICQVDKKTYSVGFDPTVIGARSVLSNVPSGKLATPRSDSTLSSDKKRLAQMAWSATFAAALTIPVVVLAWSHNTVSYSNRSLISLILATCVQAIAVPEFYMRALKSLIFSRVVEVDMLIVISITAAYGYSVVAFVFRHSGKVLEQGEFFETSTLLVTLVLVGRLISVLARLKALKAVFTKALQAEVALLVSQPEKTSKVDARLLEYGDSVLVPPYAAIVTDGDIIGGSSAVNESMITGESIPTPKRCGDSVMAGTVNGSSPLTIRATRLPGQNSVTDIANLVEQALGSKPRVQKMADEFASWFVPVVAGMSSIIFIIWIAVGLNVRHKNAGGSVGLAITYAIAVLAVSCPCAVGLAVPMVLIIAGAVAARSGIIIKQATATERSYRTTDVVFDKTGTLTTGILEVIEEEYYGQSLKSGEAKSLVLTLLKDDGHPVSSAVVERLQSQEIMPMRIEDKQSILGAGLTCVWNGKAVKAGNPYWLGVHTCPEVEQLIESGMSTLCVTIDSKLIAAYGLKSKLRPEAKRVVLDLLRRGIRCHIVSGDGAKAVQNVAEAVVISPPNIASCQSPSDKQEYIKRLIDKGNTVLFCGDGTNDAVAIAQAHVGVQIGSASDITRATADVVLTGGLECIPALLDISRRAFIRIVFNFVWSAAYNLFAILLAAGAFVRVRIPPAYAGLGEIVSIIPVILLALTLMSYKRKAL